MLSAHQKKMGKKKQIFKIKLAQSFRYAHRYRLCVYMFIRMGDHMFMSICVCTVFLKCIVAPPGPVSSDEGPLRDVYCTRPTIHWARPVLFKSVRIFRRSPRAHSRDRSPRTSCLGRPGSASSSSSRFQLIRRIHPQTPSIQKKSHHLICLSPIARPDSRFREDSSSCRKEDKPSAHEFISIWLYTSW
jgi:hypothetical protein